MMKGLLDFLTSEDPVAEVDAKPLFHSSQKPTRKLAASAFKCCDWMKVLAASLRVGFCDEWKRGVTIGTLNSASYALTSLSIIVQQMVVNLQLSE